MFEFLLSERQSVALKKYLGVLQALPAFLDPLQRHADNLKLAGHVMPTAPDGGRLKYLAAANADFLTQLESRFSAAAKVFDQQLQTFTAFIAQCRSLALAAPYGGRYVPISAVDFSTSQALAGAQGKDGVGLTQYLYFRLGVAQKALSEVDGVIWVLQDEQPTIFLRLLSALTINRCQCHSQDSLLQAWYVDSGLTLPGMTAVAGPDDPARRALADEHLQEVSEIGSRAFNAIRNLRDYLRVMRHILERGAYQLLRVGPSTLLALLIVELELAELRLQWVKSMFNHLLPWARQ